MIARLEDFEPESLGDDNPEAGGVVESAVRSHLRGMGESQAKATLRGDCDLLQKWLEQPGLENSTAHYIRGVMEGMIMFGGFDELSR